MKVCVIGAGSIGGFMGVKIAEAGHEVSLVTRGTHLAVIKKNGLKLIQNGVDHWVRNTLATDDIKECGPQDVVLLTVKTHQIISIIDDLPSLFGLNTVMVTLQNGIPWWYFQKHGGEFEGRIVEAIDPSGIITNSIDPERLIGSIAYPAAIISEPGVIQHVEGVRFPVGELDGSDSERVNKVSEMFIDAGFKSPILQDIRSEIWLKLWGNLTFNPISAMTHATLEDICQFPLSRELAATIMSEAQTIGEKLGVTFRVSLDKRIEGAEKVGKHKTSMLQDVEVGKSLEIDGMLGTVVELGRITGVATPTLNAIYACVSLLNKTIQDEKIKICKSSKDLAQNI